MDNGDDEVDRIGQDRHQRLAVRAGKQLGVVTLADLYDLRLTYRQVRRMVAEGRLHPLHRGFTRSATDRSSTAVGSSLRC
jgi:hypothetical protein